MLQMACEVKDDRIRALESRISELMVSFTTSNKWYSLQRNVEKVMLVVFMKVLIQTADAYVLVCLS